ncbi:MAG: SurA N-terminal domain-containing protein [Calditrichaeota bacterium]|nr:SurA N-terminal domain-containing protein [Calditrichota bacterium]
MKLQGFALYFTPLFKETILGVTVQMMMKMRENLHLVLYALIIVFLLTIFFSWGAGGGDVLSDRNLAGKIGSQNVTLQQFDVTVRNQMEYIRQTQGREVPSEQRDAFRKSVWEQMVNEHVLQSEIDSRNLAFSGEEFLYATYNDPIPQLKQSEQFQENGTFSPTKFKSFLQQPNNEQLAYQLKGYYESTFAQNTMQQYVENTNVVTDADVLETYKSENLKANVKFYGYRKSKLKAAKYNVTDADVQAYYDAHKKDYKVDAKRKIEYLKLNIVPTKEDTMLTLQQIEQVKENIKDGANFKEEVRYVSDNQDNVDKKDEELDWISKGNRSVAFDEAVFSAKVGEMIGPIWDFDKYVLVDVIETRKNPDTKEAEVKVREIVKRVIAGPTTSENFEYLGEDALTAAKNGTMKEFAEKNNVEYNETAYITDNGFIPGVGQNAYLSNFIFKKPVGEVSRQVRLNKGETIFIVRIVDAQDAGYQPVDQVKASIERLVVDQKKMDQGRQYLSQLKDKLRSATFKEVLKTDTTGAAETDTTGITSFYGKLVKKLGTSPELSYLVETLPLNTISEPVETSAGIFVIEVLSRTDFDQADYEAKKIELRKRLENQRFGLYRQWLSDVRKEYDIEELRLYQ